MAFLPAKLASIAAPNVPDDRTDALPCHYMLEIEDMPFAVVTTTLAMLVMQTCQLHLVITAIRKLCT